LPDVAVRSGNFRRHALLVQVMAANNPFNEVTQRYFRQRFSALFV
jgi:hypothetical protein